MNLYHKIENIKNFFALRSAGLSQFAATDAEMLSLMGLDARFLRARNGRTYFYYCPLNEQNMDVAIFLMTRNGLKPFIHNSHYYYTTRQILRIPRRNIVGNPERMNFIKSIDVTNNICSFDFNKRLREIQMQMQMNRGKTK